VTSVKWRLDDGQIEVLDVKVVEALRAMTPARRVELGLEANRTARQMIALHLRRQHPDWSDELVAAEIARRMLRGTA
jgi:hypothetical protein